MVHDPTPAFNSVPFCMSLLLQTLGVLSSIIMCQKLYVPLCPLSLYPPAGQVLFPQLEESGVQRSQITSSRSHSWRLVGQDSNPRLANSKAKFFPLLHFTSLKKKRASPSWVSCFSAPPMDGTLFSPPPTCPTISLDCLFLLTIWATVSTCYWHSLPCPHPSCILPQESAPGPFHSAEK